MSIVETIFIFLKNPLVLAIIASSLITFASYLEARILKLEKENKRTKNTYIKLFLISFLVIYGILFLVNKYSINSDNLENPNKNVDIINVKSQDKVKEHSNKSHKRIANKKRHHNSRSNEIKKVSDNGEVGIGEEDIFDVEMNTDLPDF